MKKITIFSIVILLITTFFLLSNKSISAHGSMTDIKDESPSTKIEETTHTKSVETILQEILNQQKVDTIQQLNLSKISDTDWEKLGDSIMEAQHPGKAHEIMDRMMGGEGSQSLSQMHINMGKAYLNYQNNSFGMMGGGNIGMMNGGMMDYNNVFAKNNIMSNTIFIALITFLFTGTYYFIKQSQKK